MSTQLIYKLFQLFSKGESKAPVTNLQEAYQQAKKGNAVILDVREEGEIQAGIAESARWVPTSDAQEEGPRWKKFLAETPKDKQIAVYCAAGVRAGRIAAKLETLGYRTFNIGGFKDWVKAGLPTQKP